MIKGFAKVFALVSILALVAATGVKADGWSLQETPDLSRLGVYVNGDLVWYGWCVKLGDEWRCDTYQYKVPAFERGSQISVRIALESPNNPDDADNIVASNARVKAWIAGYRDEIKDQTTRFDIFEGNSYVKNLYLKLPADLSALDSFNLHVRVEAQRELSGVSEANIGFTVQRETYLLEIQQFSLWSREQGETNQFRSGQTLYADVVVKNRGNHLAEDTYLRLSIPELQLSRTIYLGDIGSTDNNYEDTVRRTISLTLPSDAEGNYLIEAKVFNAETSTTATQRISIERKAETRVVITTEKNSQEARPGETVQFKLLLSNLGTETQTIEIDVTGTQGWAQANIPAAFNLGAGESKEVQLQLQVDREASGKKQFFVLVDYDGKKEQVQFTVNITRTAVDAETVLMVIAIALAVAIIVLLAITLTRKQTVEESYY